MTATAGACGERQRKVDDAGERRRLWGWVGVVSRDMACGEGCGRATSYTSGRVSELVHIVLRQAFAIWRLARFGFAMRGEHATPRERESGPLFDLVCDF